MNTDTYWREIFRYLGYKNGARPEGGTLRMIERAEADIRAAAEPKHAKRYFALSFPEKGAVEIDGIRIECFLVPGHTWGHMVYLVDDRYLFTGDTIWFGADGGYSFISALAEDNELAVRSLTALEEKLRRRDLHPLFITGLTGWTDNMDFAFAHKNELCSPFRKKAHDPNAPYDAYDESDDTEERAKSRYLAGVGR